MLHTYVILEGCQRLRILRQSVYTPSPNLSKSPWHTHEYTRQFLRYTAVYRYHNNAATQVYLSHQRKSGWLQSPNPNVSPSLCRQPLTPLSRSPIPFVERIWMKNMPN